MASCLRRGAFWPRCFRGNTRSNNRKRAALAGGGRAVNRITRCGAPGRGAAVRKSRCGPFSAAAAQPQYRAMAATRSLRGPGRRRARGVSAHSPAGRPHPAARGLRKNLANRTAAGGSVAAAADPPGLPLARRHPECRRQTTYRSLCLPRSARMPGPTAGRFSLSVFSSVSCRSLISCIRLLIVTSECISVVSLS